MTDARIAFRVSLALLACSLVMPPATAFGQLFEVGGMVGVGSTGNETDLWGHEDLRTRTVYASLWPGRHWETRVRRATSRLPSRDTFRNTSIGTVTKTWNDRSRTLFDLALLYHFGQTRVRPYVGLGFGWMRERLVVSCTPPACEDLPAHEMGGLPLGETIDRPGHSVVTAGLHARIGRWGAVRGAVTFSNFGGANLATTDLSIGAGIRF